MSLKDTPIRRKLMMMILLTSGAVLLLTCAAFIAYELLSFRQTMVRNVSTLGEVIAANSTASLAFENRDDATEVLAALKAERHIIAASLYDTNGKLFAKYPASLAADAFLSAPEQDGYRFEDSHLVGVQPVVQGSNKRLGTLYLQSDLVAVYERLRLYSGIAASVLAVSFLVAYLLSRVMQQQISQPILALAETAKAVSDRRDYSVRAERLGKDELGLLTDAFNQMLTQIHAQDQALREREARLRELNQKLEQRVIERTARLEAVNKELEAFCYSVSHDLRAPLRGIDGFSMILQKSYSAKLDEQGRNYLERVRAATQRMGHLIDDLLNMSQTARSEMSITTVNLSELAGMVAKDLQEAAPERKVAFSIAPGMAVLADAHLMRIVLDNLLGNAWKFSGKRAEARIEVGSMTNAAKSVYFVRDNGAGFDMRYADKLFGAFQRLHSVTAFDGTGVGLANVQRIILRHGGRVWAEAAVDQGATFYFTLPA